MTCVFYSARLYSLGVNLERPKVSIICCYTSASKLGYLDASLNRQDIPVEKVYIDNSTNRFHNAASALNFGAEESSGELLFFCHQDIKFKSSDSLSKLAAIAASKLRPGDVGGVAGATNGHAYTMITHGEEELPYTVGSMFKGESIEVETVDECVIILPRGTWESHHFDDDICDSWHFYGVEQGLHAITHHHNVFVFKADVNHLSSRGTVDETYFRALRRVMKAYGQLDSISTSVGYWPRKGLERAILKRKLFEWARGIAVRMGIKKP